MKVNSNLIVLILMLVVSVKSAYSQDSNSKWEILFDGNGTEKWRSKSGDDFPNKGWKIENGLLFLGSKGGGDIVTREKYGNFELVFEFKLTNEANSGIKYFVDSVVNQETGRVMINGPEYQIIDDYSNEHVKNDPHGVSSTGSLYLLYAPENKTLNPPGEWNSGKIVSYNGKVEHWLNGVKVVSYERGSNDFAERKSTTKFKNDIGYGIKPTGHVMLTDHNDKVYFKNIKIRKL
jgi:hypothetical protein